MATPQRIKALDENVVNKIAAGEIIVAPVNALKELIENAVDAGSTSIEIVVKDGGLKLLQITDNGSGINRDDLHILCERFTTSKLKAFEDLESIGTYGFRGEALASISTVAHLTVTTKTKDSSCAWKALYADGKLVPSKPGQSAEPKPVAGRQGTQITVEDLFYNTPSRRRAFRSASEEYSKILDVVGRYAVHCSGVAFSCKKYGETNLGVSTTAQASVKERIRRVHGSAVASEIISFEVSNKSLGFKSEGMLSNANYHVKKTTLLLFINGRSVESTTIKKAIDATYSTFLPKGGHPFVYLAIDIEPHRVDVNVHPTKREVNFLHEDEIIEKITAAIQEKLAAVDTSRSYTLTQTILPGPQFKPQRPTRGVGGDNSDQDGIVAQIPVPVGVPGSRTKTQARKPYESDTVRVDARDRKITSMLQPIAKDQAVVEAGDEYEYDDSREWEEVRYTTVKNLRREVRDSVHGGLAELFLNHTYVGLVDETRRLAAVQHGVKLYLVNYAAVSYQLFYQIGLSDFRNFGQIRLDPPILVADLLEIAVQQAEDEDESEARERPIDGDVEMNDTGFYDREGAVKSIEKLLYNKREMLRDYFSLEIDEGRLVTIPLLVKGYRPDLGKLPAFLLALGPNVVWESEIDCFKGFIRQLALFYIPPPSTSSSPPPTQTIETSKMLEQVLFPAFRKRLIPPRKLLNQNAIVEIANLKGLYKIFERSC